MLIKRKQKEPNVKLIWATPNIDKHIGYIARVSNPDNQNNENVSKLIKYMLTHGHWSPFEMASVCFEINTTRDIARQLLRHKSIHVQEFSQRYEDVSKLEMPPVRECRLQNAKNRQASDLSVNVGLNNWWEAAQLELRNSNVGLYQEAIKKGIAKEVARAVLPEGLTASRLYYAGTIRSYLTFLMQRLEAGAQKEIQVIALEIFNLLKELAPHTMQAFCDSHLSNNLNIK